MGLYQGIHKCLVCSATGKSTQRKPKNYRKYFISIVSLQAAKNGIQTDAVRNKAKQQLDYALGSTGRSYVCGFGNNPPVKPHHRAASCPDMPQPCDSSAANSPDPNPQVLYGALVGGPDANDYYVDDRMDWVHNEVALEYNSGFQGILAAVIQGY